MIFMEAPSDVTKLCHGVLMATISLNTTDFFECGSDVHNKYSV